MKLFGSIKELVSAVFRKDGQQVTLRPNQTSTYTADRDFQLPEGDSDHVVVSRTSADSLINKTLTDASNNISASQLTSGTIPDARVPSSAVTQHQATIDHDSLTGFVAEEHIDWSAAGAEDIEDGRIAVTGVTQHQASIDHDALTNFVGDEHINHSGVTLTAGEGLAGGGNITASRTFDLDVNSLTAESIVDDNADYFLMYDADAAAHKKVLGRDLPGGGAGAGEINFNTNPNADSALDNGDPNDIGDWLTFGVGTYILERTSTSSEIPRYPFQDTAIKIRKDTNAGGYTQLRFEVPAADRGKKLKIEWAQITGGGYVSGDFTVSLYSYSDAYVSGETQKTLIGSPSIPSNSGVFYLEFDADDRQYYELRIGDTATSVGKWISLNDVVVGPGKLHSGAVITAWEAFTMTVTGTGGNPTKGTTTSPSGRDVARWRRVGDCMEIEWYYRQYVAGNAGSGSYLFAIPSGYTIDTDVTGSNAGGTNTVGFWGGYSTTDLIEEGFVSVHNSTNLLLYSHTNGSVVDSGYLDFAETDCRLSFHARVPIAEWSGSGVLNTIVQDNLTEWTNYSLPGNPTVWTTSSKNGYYRQVGSDMELNVTATVATASGDFEWAIANFIPSGFSVDETSLIGGIATDRTLVGDWFAFDGSTYFSGPVVYDNSANRLLYYTAGNSGGDRVNATTPLPSAASWGSGDIINTRIKIPIAEWAGSQSSLVGFSAASTTQSGLVDTGTQSFAGVKTFNDGVQFASTAEQTTLDYYQQETHTLTLTELSGGGLSSPGADLTVYLTRIGDMVTMTWAAKLITAGTNSQAAFRNNGSTVLPAEYRPTTNPASGVYGVQIDNTSNTTRQFAHVSIQINGDVLFYANEDQNTTGTFSTSQASTIYPGCVSWNVNQ